MVSGIVRRLESMGENEIPSAKIGRLVMEGLMSLDEVAYVRFASVYKNFREARTSGHFWTNSAVPCATRSTTTDKANVAGQALAREENEPAHDTHFMKMALTLAERGLGQVAPQSGGRLRLCGGRGPSRRRARLDAGRRPAIAETEAGARRCRARGDGLCQP